jgi:hypothetical protein
MFHEYIHLTLLNVFFVQKFLVKFGYLHQAIVAPCTKISYAEMETLLKAALTDFQKFYGLLPTGKTKCVCVCVCVRACVYVCSCLITNCRIYS